MRINRLKGLMDTILYKNIIATIVYYDVLDYPLTTFEIWRHLIRAPYDHAQTTWSLYEVCAALDTQYVRSYVNEKNGLFFLHGREKLLATRRKRELISMKKMRKLKRIALLLGRSPFVRMICVTGRLAYRNCDAKSDLDVLVVYEHGHIWTGRFFATILMHVFGVRRHGIHVNDRVCLNYHITTDSLEVPTKDLFAAHEYSFIIPIYGHEYFDAFTVANTWIKNYKPHYLFDHGVCFAGCASRGTIVGKHVQKIIEWILADKGMERRLRKIQEKKIMRNPKTHIEGAIVLHNERCLVFLPEPHGPRVFEEYKRRYDALEISF